jgi:hypothetical protein
VTRATAQRPTGTGAAIAVGRLLHLHRWTWSGDDPFSSSSLYRCRCGVVRPGI